MEDDEYNWLNRFSGGKMPKRPGQPTDAASALRETYQIERAKEEITERALKDNMLDSAFQALADKKEIIRDAFNFEVEVSGKKVKTLAPQKEAFDTEHTNKITEAPKADIVRDAHAMKALLVAQKDRLTAVKVTRSQPAWNDPKNPGKLATVTGLLFTKEEIARQFYGPLEREMVIPDNFVTGDYSPTQQMLDETNDLYIKECQEKGGRRETGVAALSKAALDMVTSVTNAITGFSSATAPGDVGSISEIGASAETQAAVRIVSEGVQALVGVGIDVTDVAIDAAVSRSFSASQWQAALNNLAVSVAKTVCGALGAQDPSGTSTVGLYEALCDGISGGLSGATAVAVVAQWAKDGADFSKFPFQDFIVPIVNGIATAGSAEGDMNSPTTTISEISNGITGSAQALTAIAAKAASPEMRKQFKNGEIGTGMLALLTTVAAQISNVAIGAIANLNEDNASSAQQNTVEAQATADNTTANANEEGDFRAEIQPLEQGLKESDAVSKIVADWETANAALLAEVDKRLGVKFDMKLEAAQDVDAKTIEADLAAEKQAYQQALNRLSNDAPSDGDFKTINGLIQDIKNKRAIINLALTIASGSFGIAGGAEYAVEAVARGLKATGDVAKAVKSVLAAIDCVVALNKWLDSYGDAITSASPYASAIENFINSNRDLLCHNSVQALMSLAKALAGYTSIAIPPMASAALAMDAMASTANFVFQVYRQSVLANAWKQTIKSLQNPQDRQLALVVRELNPTLAKYTIAYGAFIARDPIAVRAVDRIGIDREVLANPNSKIGDVKDYLEELYKDDLKLVANIDTGRSRVQVPTPELTVKAWSVSYLQWSKGQDGDSPIKTPNPPQILTNLERVEKYRAIDEEKKRLEVQPQLLKALEDLDTAFTSFNALDTGGLPMPDVGTVAQAYARLSRAALQSEQLNGAAARSATQFAAVQKAAV